jgi:hypothetical protein
MNNVYASMRRPYIQGVVYSTDQTESILEFIDLAVRFRTCIPYYFGKIDQQIPWHLNNFGVMVHGQ